MGCKNEAGTDGKIIALLLRVTSAVCGEKRKVQWCLDWCLLRGEWGVKSKASTCLGWLGKASTCLGWRRSGCSQSGESGETDEE